MMRPCFYLLYLFHFIVCHFEASEIDFKKEIWPILERSCVECHKETYLDKNGKQIKPKAGLVLEHAKGIVEGSKYGKVMMPFKPLESTLYSLLILDHDDTDFMPSKGEPLGDHEIQLIFSWIKKGAHFGDWEGAQGFSYSQITKELILKPLLEELLAENLDKPKVIIEKLEQESKAKITKLTEDLNLYEVEYVSNKQSIVDEDFCNLNPLNENITRLDLSGTKLKHESFSLLSKMTNMVKLNLSKTLVHDEDLKHIMKLDNLRYLNLYKTKITNSGLRYLYQLKDLEHLYLRGTEVTKLGVEELKARNPKLSIDFGALNQFTKNDN